MDMIDNALTSSMFAARLTVQQRRALEVAGASVALAAGAGCGKTTVLTERFFSGLQENGGRALRSLTALTFTEKAARELRRRARDRCRAELRSGPAEGASGGQGPGRWLNVSRGLEAAPIGTFHGFCSQLLRRHALLAGVDPEFAVLDESVAGALRDESVAAALRRLLAERAPDVIEIGAEYGLRAVREALAELNAASASFNLEEWAALDPQAIVERWRAFVAARLWPAVLDQLDGPVRDCVRLLEALDSDDEKIRARRAEALEALRSLSSDAPPPCPTTRLEELRALLYVKGLPSRIWPSEELYTAVKDAFTALRDHIKEKSLPAFEWDDAAVLAAAERGLRFARLALAVQREHREIKQRRGALDYDDLIQKARALLRDHPEVAAPPTGPDAAPLFELVMVDEFQDTDGAQSEILRRLCGTEFQTGRLFIVGDVKQSIYRFRGAQPAIFGQWRAEFLASGRLNLSENFRSVPGVVHFANVLFNGCFDALDPGPDRAGEAAGGGHWLAPTRPRDVSRPTVEFLWPEFDAPGDDQGEGQRAPLGPSLDANEGEDDGHDRAAGPSQLRLSAGERRAIEARCLARRLRERLEAGWMVQDGPSGDARHARPGDIVLLFRSMTDLAPYESALAAEGFDYLTIGGSAFYAQQEVADVINLLSVLDDPFDELALAGALRGPFFALSDEGLYWLARARTAPNDDGAASADAEATASGIAPAPFAASGLMSHLQRLETVRNLSPTDRRRAERARAQLARWRALKDRMPMARLLELILDESGFEAAVVCDFLGERKLANTRKIVRMAREFDRQGGFTLAHLAAQLRADFKDQLREEQAATAGELGDNLRLMSIHQAKGLEFPIVVVPDLARRASGGQSSLAVVHPELGLVVRPPRATPSAGAEGPDSPAGEFPHRARVLLDRIEDDRESLRLFYVAVTRARDSLVLSAGYSATEPAPAASVAFRLLDERFDRATGEPRSAPSAGGLSQSSQSLAVHVERMKPPGPRPETPTTRRMAIAEVATAISSMASAEPGAEAEAPAPARSPRYVDLGPNWGLAPRAARLSALVAAILCAPRRSRGEPLEAVAARLAGRQAPAAPGPLVREALERAARFENAPEFSALRAAAAAGPGTVDLDREFGIELLANGPTSTPTTFHGRCDALFRDPRGDWRLIAVADVRSDMAREQLRLRVGARAATARGAAPIVEGWLVVHGPPGEERIEAVTDFDDATIARWLGELA